MSAAEGNNPESAAVEEEEEEKMEEEEDPDAGVMDEQRAIEESIRLAQQQQQDEEATFARMVEEAMRLSEMSAREEEMSREYNDLREQSEKYKDFTYRVEREVVEEEDKRPLLDRAVEMSEVVEDGPPKVYKLTGTPVGGNDKRRVRRLAYGPANRGVREKTVLMVGETGSGKSTLIDSLSNYIMGGKSPDDPYRFRIVDVRADEVKEEAVVSQTDWITCYSVNKMTDGPVDFNLNIIDTPGFGDTRGIDRDRSIVHQIRDLFETMDEYGIQCLDAVCIVIKGSVNRLTATQKYIFDSLMALFGKDIGDNIVALSTFYDGTTEGVENLKKSYIPYKELFNFNNSAMTAKTPLGRIYWDMMMDNWKLFLDAVEGYISRSLKLTVDVLEERQKLQDGVAVLIPLINDGLNKMHNNKLFKDESRDKSDHVSIEYKSCTRQRKQCAHVYTNCSKCKRTCVRREIKLDPTKKCHHCDCQEKEHQIEKFKWENEIKPTNMTIGELKRMYNVQNTKELAMALNKEYQDTKQQVECNIKSAKASNSKLEEIALRPRNQSVVEYVDLLIAGEKGGQGEGWVERIVELQQLRKEYVKQEELVRGSETVDWN